MLPVFLKHPEEYHEVNNIEFKWFASCKSVHSPITAAMEIYQSNPGRQPDDISRITAEVNSSAMSMAGHMYREDSVVSAQISIPYGIALGLTGRQGQADDYTFERLADKQLRSLSEKTEVVVTEEEKNDMIVLRLKVSESDMGKVIGRSGRIAKALRQVLNAAASRDKLKVVVDIG